MIEGQCWPDLARMLPYHLQVDYAPAKTRNADQKVGIMHDSVGSRGQYLENRAGNRVEVTVEMMDKNKRS